MTREIPSGVIAMLVTPFDKDGRINFTALGEEIAWCVRNGAKGIVVTPSIGEFAVLSKSERVQCLEFCKDYADKRYPDLYLIATIASTNTPETIEYAHIALSLGYDAGQLNPPYYWIPDEEEVYQYYVAVAKAELPIVVYDNPMLSKFDITARLAGRLAKIPGIIAMKEVKTDRQRELEPLFQAIRGRVKVYTTFRAFTTGMWLGSSGGFINVFALPFCVKMWNMYQTGDLRAYRHMEEIQSMVNTVFPRGGENNPNHIGTTKMAARVVTDIPMGAPRAPYRLPEHWVEEELRAKLPQLQELISRGNT